MLFKFLRQHHPGIISHTITQTLKLEWDFDLGTPDFKPGGTQATQLFVVVLVVVVENKKTSIQFVAATPFLYCLDSFLSNR